MKCFTRHIITFMGVTASCGCVLLYYYYYYYKRTCRGIKNNFNHTQLQTLSDRDETYIHKIIRLFDWFSWPIYKNTIVVLRTCNPQDAALYYSLLIPLQQQLKCAFTLIIQTVEEFDKVLVVEICTREFHNEQSRTILSSSSVKNLYGIFTLLKLALLNETKTIETPMSLNLNSNNNNNNNNNNNLVLCSIPLPDQRVYRHFPMVVSRLISAHVNNRRLFSSYAEELLFYIPYIGAHSRRRYHHHHHHHQWQKVGSTREQKLKTPASSMRTNSTKSFSDLGCLLPSENVVFPRSLSVSSVEGKDSSITALLGDLIDINATLFSTSLLAEFGDEVVGLAANTGDIFTKGEDQYIYDAIYDAFFNVVFRTPLARPDVSAAKMLQMHPFEVWRACRRSRRAAAELYVLDVVSAKGDAMICYARVVDEVVAQAVLIHHGGSLVEFVDALFDRFSLRYIPVVPALRKAVERRLANIHKRREQQQQREEEEEEEENRGESCTRRRRNFVFIDNELKPASERKINESNVNNDNNEDEEEEEEEEDMKDVLKELPYTREFILKHCITFYNAMLTTSGSNQLEEVFGVPATVFPFLPCARESVAFVTHAYESIVAQYGPLTFHNFTQYAYDVFVQDGPEIVRHAPRIFRMLNKTRSGVISFEELCCWMARKLSSGLRLRPDAHLLAIAMSLRLPLALLLDSRQQWSRMECALASLSDSDVDAY